MYHKITIVYHIYNIFAANDAKTYCEVFLVTEK